MSAAIHHRTSMSDAETLMWRLEPHVSSNFANLTILDRPPDVERLRRRMAAAAERIPRLRQRVLSPPAGVGTPSWVADPDFDLDAHVRHVALPDPGSMRQLLDLASLITADPFDRQRPLWQFVVVEGLADGSAALVQKVHHTLTDGEGGIELSLAFLDLERDPVDDDPPASPTPPEATSSGEIGTDPDLLAAESMRQFLGGAMRVPLGIANEVRRLLAEPARLAEASSKATDLLREIGQHVDATSPARSPLWGERSARGRMEVITSSLDGVKQAARRHGGTLNTGFVTAVAAAAGRYHRELGNPVDTLHASIAVSTRTPGAGANAFSLARVAVPTGELAVGERFATVDAAIAEAVDATPPRLVDSMVALAANLPTAFAVWLARQQSGTVDVATSNVKGSPVPVYVAGAEVTNNYPVGPLGGVACNLTLLSYRGQIDIGINTDRAAVTEPELFRDCVQSAIEELIAAG